MSKISKKTVRLGILGTGRMADYHAEKFQAVKDCQIIAAVAAHLALAPKPSVIIKASLLAIPACRNCSRAGNSTR